jgi:hypothetical protein
MSKAAAAIVESATARREAQKETGTVRGKTKQLDEEEENEEEEGYAERGPGEVSPPEDGEVGDAILDPGAPPPPRSKKARTR